MALEYELRFGITAKDAQAFQKLQLSGTRPETEHLANIYFDTADFLFSSARCSLRIRDDGIALFQTLKVPADTPDARHEFEREVSVRRPELSIEEVQALPFSLHGELKVQPVFTTAYRRLAWEVNHGASLVEVALDIGTITAGSLTAPISEVELELKSGRAADVKALAEELRKLVPLSSLTETKSSRGAALARQASR